MLGPNVLYVVPMAGIVGVFSFLSVKEWTRGRQKEREAFYKSETLRRITEATSDGAKAAIDLLREDERLKRIKSREGLKIGGVINVGLGIGLIVFFRVLLGPGGVESGGAGSAYLCGLIPGFIGVAMLIYVYFMAGPIE